jgi:branched-chain amino acid transport system ATP-binding protein
LKSAMVLEIRDLSVDYGEIPGVRHLTMSVADGEIVALLGANGAGKSTTLKAVMGMLKPTHGRILVNGEDVTGRPPHAVARRGIALVPEGRRMFKRMTVRENLEVGGVTRGRTEIPGLMAGVFALFPRLKERQSQLAGTLSGGEQQMLAIGRALMAKPDFVLFDEPSLGLAPRIVDNVFDAIGRISRELGIGGILVEQKVDAALKLVERAHVLSRGAVVLSGPASLLRGSARLQAAYLGTLNQDTTDVIRR